MTNEQTHIMLKQMAARLEAAIDEARDMLPEAQRETVMRHSWPGCNGFMCLNPSHSKPVDGPYPLALSPLRQLLEEWQGQAALLAPHKAD